MIFGKPMGRNLHLFPFVKGESLVLEEAKAAWARVPGSGRVHPEALYSEMYGSKCAHTDCLAGGE